jgi:ATP-dependent Clp protease, protease subunit
MSHHVVVREKTENGLEQFDVYSRLLQDRIIYIDTDFNDEMASLVVAQLLFLSNKNKEEDITMYINSPGGSVVSGMAIYDTMQMIPNIKKTVVTGQAASMGAFIASSGTKGHRYATPSSRIMIHMVSGGAQGTTKDVIIRLEEQKRLNEYLNRRLALHCGKKITDIEKATDRDYWMAPDEAVKFGIIDKVLYPDQKNSWKF